MPKVEDYKITLMENTRNWSDEIQPAVDLIASLDGDLGDISDIDLSLASSITKNDNVFKSSKIFQEFGGFFDSKEETNIKLALLDLLKSELSDNSLLYPLLRVEYTDGNSHSLLGSLEKVKDLLLSLKLTLEIKGDITPQEKMELLDAVIRLNGFNPSTKAMLNTLSENIFGNSYNCLSYSLIGYIIGQEMKWPVSMVITRNHAYLRWDDGKVAFNFDQGEIHSDEHYKNQFDTFPEKTIYLKPLTHQQVESFALLNYLALTESVTDREILDFTTIPDDLKNLPDFWYTLSYIAQGHQDFEQALVYIKAAEKLDPEAPAIKYLLGAAHYKLSNFAQAEKHYDEFLQTDLSKVPEEHIESVARALINLADIKIGLNDLEGAREVAKRTRRLFPEKNKPLLQLGMAYSGLENFSMARYYLKRFIKTADNEKYNYYIAYFTLSSIELDGENFEGALPYLERAVEFAPEEAHCWYMLALTYRHIGRWENALSAAKIAFQLDPFTEGHVTFYMKIQEEQNSFFSSFTNDLIF